MPGAPARIARARSRSRRTTRPEDRENIPRAGARPAEAQGRIAMLRLSARATLTVMMALCALPALAQDYPTRPVFIVVGPGPDTMARLFGQKLSEAWGQQGLVAPQPAGGGVAALRAVARAQPDGHTMLLTTGSYTINEALRPNLPVLLLRDFEPGAEIGALCCILIINASVPV